MSSVYAYDRADDGPEVEVITRIRASHDDLTLGVEPFDFDDLDDWGDLLV